MTQIIKPPPPAHWLPPVVPPPAEPPTPLPSARPGWQTGTMPAILAGLAAMAVGLFMPWITLVAPFIGQISRSGIDTGDGKFAGGAIAIVAILAFLEAQTPHYARRIFMLILVLVVGTIVAVDYNDIAGRVAEVNADDFGSGQVGTGLYLMGAGAVVAAVALFSRMMTLARR